MLQESTHVGPNGFLRHKATFIPVPRSPTKSSHQWVSDEPTAYSGPVFEPDEIPTSEAESSAEDEGEIEPRAQRSSDDPLRQWVTHYRESFLDLLVKLEGRGDHGSRLHCAACGIAPAEYRCDTCFAGGELLCRPCIVKEHDRHPLHVVKLWNGSYFDKKSLKELGLRIQLGHWLVRGSRCPLPAPAPGGKFIIIGDGGIHRVALDFCGCGKGGSHNDQLMHAGLYPATVVNPRTAATFLELDRFVLMNYELKCSAWDYYNSLARATENTGLKKTPGRYSEFARMGREWTNLMMLKRAGRCHDPSGIAGVSVLVKELCDIPYSSYLLYTSARDAAYHRSYPKEKQFLYALFLAMDANFRLKRKDVSTERKDPGLGDGWSFYCEVTEYMEHVAQHWDTPQERSTCVSHDAVDRPDREARGTASSGIGAVDCARHNMRRPLAVGDLQFGERYINMDYMFFRSIAGSDLIRLVVSYDIACQWHINIWNRMAQYKTEIQIENDGTRSITFLVPKFHLPAHIEACNLLFSFNLTPNVGQTDGEAPKRNWANSNPLAGGTMQMGPGARRDTLNAHFNDLNWKKNRWSRKTVAAVPEMVVTKKALESMEKSLRAAVADEDAPDAVKAWTEMVEKWEIDPEEPNPYETVEKDDHLAKVWRELAEEAAARAEDGEEGLGDIFEGMHVSEMMSMGLQLEENQRVLGFDMAAMGQHSTDGQQQKLQEAFVPRVTWLRHKDDDARAQAARSQPVPGVRVQELKLWMPSEMMGVPGALRRKEAQWCPQELQQMEYRLRVAQANEALHNIRWGLLVRTHLYKYKDKNVRGVRQNTRSKDKINAVDELIRRSATRYRAARRALVSLGKSLGEHGWEVTLQELKEEHVRAMPISTLGDSIRQSGGSVLKGSRREQKERKKRKTLPTSWIWLVQKRTVAGEKQAMNEALRIEWAKTRTRSMCWREEVDLLEEEMRRVKEFMTWRSDWWVARTQWRESEEEAMREGLAAYALRQAALFRGMREAFSAKWVALPDLIENGRAGVVASVDDEDEWADVESGEESGAESVNDPVPQAEIHPIMNSHMDD
ncbi:hypothetical protein FB45DRAFT_1034871 [Roridomyces roridus]|uniref:CxC2-like cysteine cluster KDZ transposase-associated domain-containing protein n=1 Tax=Roridomyces roridus TaxID=1738132 RepID=A0AAD7BCA8_9AGAR|nr:hypothetical protein FB45DRAFT_1034871 [Roridomyces roridus]